MNDVTELNWDADLEEVGLVYTASSLYHDDGTPFMFKIVPAENSLYKLESDAELMCEGEEFLRFIEVQHAKDFCQRGNDSIYKSENMANLMKGATRNGTITEECVARCNECPDWMEVRPTYQEASIALTAHVEVDH